MNIFSTLLVLFITIPVVELMVLFQLHELIGWGRTIIVVVATGLVGASLVKKQGTQVLFEIQRQLAKGMMPADRILDGIMILIAGAFLITPGVLTDTTGFLLLIPLVRTAIRRVAERVLERKLRNGSIDIHYHN